MCTQANVHAAQCSGEARHTAPARQAQGRGMQRRLTVVPLMMQRLLGAEAHAPFVELTASYRRMQVLHALLAVAPHVELSSGIQ